MASKSGPPLLSYHPLMDGPHHISWNGFDTPKIELGFGKTCDSSTKLEGDKENGRLTPSSNINGRRIPFPFGNAASPQSEAQEESDLSEEIYRSIGEYEYDPEEEMGCSSSPTSTSGNDSHPRTPVLPSLCDNGKDDWVLVDGVFGKSGGEPKPLDDFEFLCFSSLHEKNKDPDADDDTRKEETKTSRGKSKWYREWSWPRDNYFDPGHFHSDDENDKEMTRKPDKITVMAWLNSA